MALGSAALLWACAGPGRDAGDPAPRQATPLELALMALPIELDPARWQLVSQGSPLPPVPADPTNRVADDRRAALLGRALFFDPRLSDDGQTSCATCHVPELGFDDGEVHRVAPGDHLRRTPGLLNVGHLRWLGWDGRKDSLWSQALGPLEAAREQNTSRVHVVRTVLADPDLAAALEAVFGPLPALEGLDRADEHARPVWHDADHPLSQAWAAMDPELRREVDQVFVYVGKALAAYERQLVSGPAPFDRFVAAVQSGDRQAARLLEPAAEVPSPAAPDSTTALERDAALDLGGARNPSALRGLELFFGRANCHTCHNGPLFTDYEFHDTLLPFEDDGRPDRGRHLGIELVREDPFGGLGEYSDDPDASGAQKLRFLPRRPHQYAEFKTPSLRDLGPGPYMHRGEFASLGEVLRHYNTLAGARRNAHGGEAILVPLDLDEGQLADLEAFLLSLRGAAPPLELWGPPSRAELRQLAD
ncbi:Cytochrome c551 peroxidase precursor [Planctomycetes bacterium Pla86]|uniref:Cytochrome c551 peroxidase n=2 Tax=Engelhardtia mirabilis TaxID=2528011 RepID=A0A518BRH9_9BACT|nr:Cytochrome c551 peroxidase precursor [Planctomycetes bacterium Pla133]QDV03889.1 Cytochrome c551 peroxidase precursor [Planctomycetes bacterium Pla86]